MSLLLDARKRSQQTLSAQSGNSGLPERTGMRGVKRNMTLSLSITAVLCAAGAGYLSHTEPAGNRPPLEPRLSDATSETRTRNISAPAIFATHNAENTQPKQLIRAALTVTNEQTSHNNRAIRIKQHKAESLDPLLSGAYRAYRSGKLDEARQLYGEMLAKDAHHTDALLGLAVIAQQRGEDILAVRYYTRILRLDPRNAAANAGMSALSTDEHNESRLKTLLDEQRDSATLHFALGNHYAGQSRWGEAQQAYFSACTLEPDNTQFTFNLAISLDHLGQHELAAQHYQHALQLDQAGVLDHAQIEQRLYELTR